MAQDDEFLPLKDLRSAYADLVRLSSNNFNDWDNAMRSVVSAWRDGHTASLMAKKAKLTLPEAESVKNILTDYKSFSQVMCVAGLSKESDVIEDDTTHEHKKFFTALRSYLASFYADTKLIPLLMRDFEPSSGVIAAWGQVTPLIPERGPKHWAEKQGNYLSIRFDDADQFYVEYVQNGTPLLRSPVTKLVASSHQEERSPRNLDSTQLRNGFMVPTHNVFNLISQKIGFQGFEFSSVLPVNSDGSTDFIGLHVYTTNDGLPMAKPLYWLQISAALNPVFSSTGRINKTELAELLENVLVSTDPASAVDGTEAVDRLERALCNAAQSMGLAFVESRPTQKPPAYSGCRLD